MNGYLDIALKDAVVIEDAIEGTEPLACEELVIQDFTVRIQGQMSLTGPKSPQLLVDLEEVELRMLLEAVTLIEQVKDHDRVVAFKEAPAVAQVLVDAVAFPSLQRLEAVLHRKSSTSDV